jgi:hypothetical protein
MEFFDLLQCRGLVDDQFVLKLAEGSYHYFWRIKRTIAVLQIFCIVFRSSFNDKGSSLKVYFDIWHLTVFAKCFAKHLDNLISIVCNIKFLLDPLSDENLTQVYHWEFFPFLTQKLNKLLHKNSSYGTLQLVINPYLLLQGSSLFTFEL